MWIRGRREWCRHTVSRKGLTSGDRKLQTGSCRWIGGSISGGAGGVGGVDWPGGGGYWLEGGGEG